MSVWLRYLIITYAIFVLQATLAGALEIHGVRPDFVVLGLLMIVPELSGRRVLAVASCWGLLSDGLAPSGVGVNVVCFSIASFGYWHLQQRVAARSTVGRSLLIFPAAMTLLATSCFLRETLAGQVPAIASLLSRAALSAAYTAGLSLVIAMLVSAVRWRLSSSEPAAPAVRNRWRMLTE